ncbi:LOW QUALITY PROTEIN: hypothetical protein U9M48_020671 [Paspalum notatum var. saurae]|uniref:Uncharacterized protein n=1 Tax=Paspalum notatum var. saurae TaxID=547442 RepID=A0AAQ3TFL7_PASNO
MARKLLALAVSTIVAAVSLLAPRAAGYPWPFCGDSYSFEANSTHESNLKFLAATLPKNISASRTLYATAVVGAVPDQIWAMGLCRGDTNASICLSCVTQAFQDLSNDCPYSNDATIYYDYCIIHYSGVDTLAGHYTPLTISKEAFLIITNNNVTSDPARFRSLLAALMNATVEYAANNSTRRFATGEADFDQEWPKVYTLAQCVPEQTPVQCGKCLAGIVASDLGTFEGNIGGSVLGVNCSYRYETMLFFNGPAMVRLASPSSRVPALEPVGGTPAAAGAGGNMSKQTKMIVGIACGVGASSLLVACFIFIVWHKRKRKLLPFLLCKKINTAERNIEALIVSYGSLAPKRYKYSEAIKTTSSLNNKLGEGSYGTVFKGKLDDGRLVAVKFLHDSKGEGEEFVNEVMSIGRTSHVNIVGLFGFCLEGSKRVLIYEYMPNGSLDRYIYSENPKAVLGWDKLYMIAIGIARGLEYLHHSCNTRIVHFDIKPQNILLDQDFHPKIADFGLAKLCRTKESKLSMTGARGTVGFIAPEVHSRAFGVVSTKSDVYSYGMMLLEMVGGRKNVKSVAQKSSEKYFPHWIYDHFGQDDGLEACEVTSGNEEIAKKMSVIGLWCIQILPMHRPTITKVLEMFERGLNDLDMPPRQNFSQILEDPAYAAEVRQEGPLCPPTLCGGVNIFFPFGIVADHATARSCGEFEFQVVCDNNTTPYLGHNQEHISLQILDIFYDNYSLVVADARKVQIFNTSGDNRSCHIWESSNTSSKVGQPFVISPANQNLILYNCTEAPPPAARERLVETVCGNDTFLRVAERSNQSGGYYGSYFLEGCEATIVPVIGGFGNPDASNYKKLIADGFLLTGSPPPADSSSSCRPQGMRGPEHHLPEPGWPPCGAPSLRINCTSTGAFLVTYSVLQAYQVLNIFTHNKCVHVVDEDLPLDTGCPAPTVNVSFLAPALTTSKANKELLFLGKCTDSPPSVSTRFHSLPCDNTSFVRLGDERGFSSHGIQGGVPPGCLFVIVPICWAPDGNGDDYLAAMRNGFLQEWTDEPDDCPRCMESGGECVYIPAFYCDCCGSMLPEMCIGASSLLVACFIFIVWHKRKTNLLHFLLCKKINTAERNVEALIITSSLNNKLGEGSYGTVFKGKLDDGRLVAVKFLNDSKGEGGGGVCERSYEYWQDLSCSKWALIYEYMPNGSQDRYIYSENPKAVLGWDKLYVIAIGIARGLKYLHHSCNTRIIRIFTPKIADFGLAKLCRTKESKLSMIGARGTVGYGMMLLEMVGGRKNVKPVAQKSSEKYFPHWIYDHFGQDDGLEACEVTSGNEGIAKKMSVIGRFGNKGLNDLDMPPRQNFSQILEDPPYGLNAESSSSSYSTKAQVSNEVLKMKEISIPPRCLRCLRAEAAAAEDGRSLCPPALCGDVNIPFQFGIVPDHATRNCGEIGFQVVCGNNTPEEYLSFQILDISYDNTPLVVADVRKLEMFNTSGHRACHISQTNSSLKLGQSDLLDQPCQSEPDLIFYNCTRKPPPAARWRLVVTACRNNTFVRVAETT